MSTVKFKGYGTFRPRMRAQARKNSGKNKNPRTRMRPGQKHAGERGKNSGRRNLRKIFAYDGFRHTSFCETGNIWSQLIQLRAHFMSRRCGVRPRRQIPQSIFPLTFRSGALFSYRCRIRTQTLSSADSGASAARHAEACGRWSIC